MQTKVPVSQVQIPQSISQFSRPLSPTINYKSPINVPVVNSPTRNMQYNLI